MRCSGGPGEGLGFVVDPPAGVGMAKSSLCEFPGAGGGPVHVDRGRAKIPWWPRLRFRPTQAVPTRRGVIFQHGKKTRALEFLIRDQVMQTVRSLFELIAPV